MIFMLTQCIQCVVRREEGRRQTGAGEWSRSYCISFGTSHGVQRGRYLPQAGNEYTIGTTFHLVCGAVRKREGPGSSVDNE